MLNMYKLKIVRYVRRHHQVPSSATLAEMDTFSTQLPIAMPVCLLA